MSKSQIDSPALLAAIIAAALALMLSAGPFALLSSLGGLVLLFILFSYDQDLYRSVFQSLAYSAVAGFCFALACSAIFQILSAHGEVHMTSGQWSSTWMPLAWAFATLIIMVVDRTRMSGRQQSGTLPQARPANFRMIPVQPAPPTPAYTEAPHPEPAPPRHEPASPQPTPAPVFTPPVREPSPGPSPTLVRAAPIAPAPLPPTPEPVPAPIPEPIPAAMPSSVTSIPSSGGKETTIYVSLLGEGMNVLRSVQAEHVGRDFYRILEKMPEGETWEFQPGQVVRCKKRTLSGGKSLVAIEEAPRA